MKSINFFLDCEIGRACFVNGGKSYTKAGDTLERQSSRKTSGKILPIVSYYTRQTDICNDIVRRTHQFLSKCKMIIVYYHIAARGWIITGNAIIQLYTIHER